MGSYQKTVIVFGVLLAAVTAVFLYMQYGEIWERAVEEEKRDITSHIQDRASVLIFPEDFTDPDTVHQQVMFEGFFDAIQSPEIVRLKIWNEDHVIVWSNLKGLIGQKFEDNEEVAEAFAGEVVFEIAEQSSENSSERDYAELAEAYIPFADATGKIVGVLEVYKSTVKLRERVNSEFKQLALAVVAGVLLVYFLFALLLKYVFNFAKKTR